MFTHILLPTNGTQRSEAAVLQGIQLAKGIHATVTGFYVIPEFHVFTYRTEMLEDTKEQFAKDGRTHARKYLGVIEKAAKEAGVTCDTAFATSDHPHDAIVHAAEKKGCDLIMMASHGRRGAQGILMGSETQKALTNSKIPVLVYR